MTSKLPAAVLFAAAALATAGPAQAQPRGRGRPAAGPPLLTLATVAPAEYETPDADTVIQAIQAAAVGGSGGARSIAEVLLRGVPPQVAAAGLDALGVLADPQGAPAVLRFLQHRRPTLRRHAVSAARSIHTQELTEALVGRLGDSDEDVRVEAATALGELGDARVVAPLFAALDRDLDAGSSAPSQRLVVQCAVAIGHAGTAEQVTRLLTYLRRLPFAAMSEAMRAAVARGSLPEALRLRIVATLGDLATGEAREFLEGVVSDAGGRASNITRAAQAAADRIAQ